MTIPILCAERHWVCSACDTTAVTNRADVHSQFHNCPGLLGLWAPMVQAGTNSKIEAREREDYVGREQVQLNREGRPIMSVQVTRDDGEDCAVYAPAATADSD